MRDQVAGQRNSLPSRGNPQFTAWADQLVEASAPRVFGLVEGYDEGSEGEIIAWGMALDDRAEVVAVDGRMRGSFQSAESAHRLFALTGQLHLVWLPDH